VTVLLLVVGAATVASLHGAPVSGRLAVRVERLATLEDGRVEACETTQLGSAGSSRAFTFWSTLGESGSSDAGRCGPGAFPVSPGASQAPFLIQEVLAVVGWDPGAMDPGPVGALQVHLTVTSRVSGTAVKDNRSIRLEPGEEYFLPMGLEPGPRATLGVREVLLRIRAGWAEREGAIVYGTVAVAEAAPGSAILVDGGVAGTTGEDGNRLLPNIPVGQREIQIQGTSGSVSRTVVVVQGRTVLVMPGAADGGAPRPPTLTPMGKNPGGFEEYRRVRDGATMIRIPEGEFQMGNLETEGEPLPHTVHVSSFLMDKLPLTVGRYKRFAAATGRPLPPDPYWGVQEGAPVAFVRWEEAKAYCEWAGGRLPTEAEREKAARGTDGRMYPWGNEPPSPERAVFAHYWGEAGNEAVGTHPSGASPYGLLDAEGNMWEFCEDWWDAGYYETSPRRDPPGPKTGRERVVRGGSWDSRWVVLSAAKRNFAHIGYREGDFGFRCAAEPPT